MKPFQKIEKTPGAIPMMLIMALLTATTAQAATYYVDSIEGSDLNPGLSTNQAWKSLDIVNAQTFKPGDHILFRAGSRYAGQLKPNGSGTPKQPICIDRYGEGTLPRIDGEGNVLSTVLLKNVEGWELRNLEITNTGKQRAQNRRGVHILNTQLTTARHFVLDGLYVHDVNGSIAKGRHSGKAILAEVPDSKKLRFDGLIIENCRIKDCERDAIRIWGVHARDIWFPSIHVIIRNNLIEGVGGDGIVPVGCDGALIERNTMRDCTRLGEKAGFAAGIWPWGCDNTIIQFNEVSGHKAWGDAQGFDSDYNCKNTLIQYNYSHDNEGGFLLICCPGEKRSHGLSTFNRQNTGTVIRYNISINDGFQENYGARPYFSPVFHITGPVKNTRIYNNIIVVTKKTDPKMDRSIVAMDNWGEAWPEQTLFANNIFIAEDSADFTFGEDTGTVFSNNLYFGAIKNRPDDTGAILTDPKFAGPIPQSGQTGFEVLKGFMLQKDSPCIRAGIKLADGELTDFFGHSLSKTNAPSIGVHEPETSARND